VDKKIKLTFLPGCFDTFSGTQEELDELISVITDFFESKTSEELQEHVLSLEDLNLDDDEVENITSKMNNNRKTLN